MCVLGDVRYESPVHTDGTQVEDGGSAQQDIHGHQSITDVRAEGPDSSQELDTHTAQQTPSAVT